MTKSLDLDVAAPEQVAAVLRAAAEQYRAATTELQAAWQDRQILVWDALAEVLERAARQAEKAVGKHQ